MTCSLYNYLKNNGIILLIIIVAAILRLWSANQIPFTHDEFSALFRTKFDSFHHLIEFGVKPDGHPALIQVFLFYWVKIFGFNELPIKLPFIIFGIASVYLIYIIAKQWYNQTVALISAAFMASLQYPVMYSQIARPYISGLFFSLLMVLFWIKLMQKPQFQFWKNGLFYVLFSTLCAYNHYFSLLFSTIVGITGLFVLKKRYLFKYSILGFGIFILFIPHLGIFYHQLKIGSVEEWLAKPHLAFLGDYIQYVFHFSLFVGLLVIALIIFGIILKKEKPKHGKKYMIISIVWFLMPMIVGFIYSYLVGAVLQFSVLIFSFPYFLFLIFGNIPNLNIKFNLLIISVILIVNIFSLIFERHHYKLFYQSVYEQLIIETQNAQVKFGRNCISIVFSSKSITDFYLINNKINPDLVYLENEIKPLNFIDFLKGQKAEYLSLGCLSYINPVDIQLITEYFPCIVVTKNYAGGSFYIFSKHKILNKLNSPIRSVNDFESPIKAWEVSKAEYLVDNLSYAGKKSYLMTANQEYSPTYKGNLNQFIKDRNDFIDISVMVYSKGNLNDVYIASTLENNEKIIDSRVTGFTDYITDSSVIEWHKVFHTIKLSDIKLKNSQTKLKVFIWNKSKENFNIDNFEIKYRKGNPYIYGLLEKN